MVLRNVSGEVSMCATEHVWNSQALPMWCVQVNTLRIRREQVCTSVRTVSGGWSVLHCAVRSQDLPTLEVGRNACRI